MQIHDYAASMVGVDLGPCYQIAAVVDGLLCGLVGKTVARLEENCKRLLGDEFDRVLMHESPIVSNGTKSVLAYLEEFELDKKYGGDIFTCDLKSLSGAILHRLVFAFRITYVKLVREQTGRKLPIIIDSPNGREVEKDLIRKMMSVLLRDFAGHQFIIATIFNDNLPQQKLITLEKG